MSEIKGFLKKYWIPLSIVGLIILLIVLSGWLKCITFPGAIALLRKMEKDREKKRLKTSVEEMKKESRAQAEENVELKKRYEESRAGYNEELLKLPEEERLLREKSVDEINEMVMKQLREEGVL